ncbi:MAG: translation initiation factor IF-2 [Lachnoclostridium sp.]|nr:translation initiation factor IF-2 [Lachnospira sp.]MCM1247920.1 translation initiation factor IF-2 [Lachnoclostridium sp.]MCM1535707.1 translation initiation factor IF-2 [Clostridium sp.]
MAKIKVHELAKELGMPSKDMISFLQEKGVEVKAPQSSVGEDTADMARKAFGGSKDAKEPEKEAKEPEKEAKGPAKEAASRKEEPEQKTQPQKEQKGRAADAPGEDVPQKKKKIIFVSNPQNSKMTGQRQGGNLQQKNRNTQQGRNQAPTRPIKPLTPPSPTPSVQMVPDNHGMKPKRPAQAESMEAKESAVREGAYGREKQAAGREPQAAGIGQQALQGREQQPGQAAASQKHNDRPHDNRSQDNRNRDNNQSGGSNANSGHAQTGRSQGQGAQRSQSGPYQGRGGAGNGRPQGVRPQGVRPQGDRQNGNQRPFKSEGGAGDRRGRDAAPGRGYGNSSDRDRRGGSKGFAPEAGAKDSEKKREEEKRRFSQEKDKRSKKDLLYEEEENVKNKPGRFIKPEKKKEEVEEVIKVITLPEVITIKELAEKMKQQPAAIIKKLFLEGKVVTVNQEISYEDAENIAMEYEILCEKEVKVDIIEELLKEEDENEADMVPRPPVICVMGHVDHGKTSLLDAVRKTNVIDKEAGGITQHIGAYTVNVGEKKITFLDTPGHEAFTAMRMRGANATDIAILVVAADDGVMPQTVEAINHAKAAGIEIIVAVNKIDKPSANIDRVKQELAEYELIPEDWGGSTVFAPVSAKSGEGIDQLLEMILLTADILELKANPKRKARGLVIEAELDKGRGPVATVLVQKGTLKVGDFISAGASHGKVRAMVDDKGRRVKEAGPSTPVEILGLSAVPSAGEVFLAHDSDKTAKNYADTYLVQNKEKKLEETKSRMSLEDLFSQIKEGNLKELNLIVKADVQGSVEAVKQSLLKLSNEEIIVKCIHGGVGAINESDVTLASASNAIIIGFNVRPDAAAKDTAEREGVDVRLYKVIYQAIEDVEAAMKGMLDPVYEEKVIGHAEVRQLFKASAIGNIAGAYVLDGEFRRGCKVRITREGEQIFEGNLASLKRFKDDVKEVKAGFECGLVFEGFDKMQELDIVEAYVMEEVPRT